jgi:AraC-like DNA-binding protein
MQVFLQFYVLFVISGILLLTPLKTIFESHFLKIILGLIAYSGIIRVTGTLYSGIPDFFSWSVFVAHLLFTPAAYLYLRNMVLNRSVDKTDRMHLLPFLIFCVGSLVSYTINGSDNFWLTNNWLTSDFLDKSSAMLNAVLFVLTAFYFGMILLTVKQTTISIAAVQTGNHQQPISTEFLKEHSEESEAANIHRSTLLTDQRVQQIDEIVTRFLDEKKPFLQQRYSLKDLAEDTQIPLHQLSAYINKHCGKNFNDFINEYRVQYCKEKILNDECRNKKLEAVAEESGFNNRNTFAIAFKKVTGINPSQFLKQVKSGVDEYSGFYSKPSLGVQDNVYCEV